MRGDGVFVRDGKFVQYGTHDGGGLGEVVHELRRRVQPPPYCHDPLCHRRCLHLPSTHSRSRATQSDIACRSKEQQAQAAFHLDRRTREAQRLQLGSDHSGPTLLEPVTCSHCCCTQGEQEEQCLAVSADGRHSPTDDSKGKTHRSPPSCVSRTDFSRAALVVLWVPSLGTPGRRRHDGDPSGSSAGARRKPGRTSAGLPYGGAILPRPGLCTAGAARSGGKVFTSISGVPD